MKRSKSGFTLAELLIALAILGVIATFSIPKILSSTSSGQNTSVAKETASMISAALSNYTLTYGLTSGVTAGAITPYLNYVNTDTASTVGSDTCGTSSIVCLRLHSGGIMSYNSTNTFGGTTTTNALVYNVDPDGSGTATPITFIQFYNGRLSTRGVTGAVSTGYAIGGTSATAVATDPSYLTTWN